MSEYIPPPKVCAFDFDGTLVDTMPEFANIAAEVMHQHYGIPLLEGRRQYLETSGIPYHQQLRIIVPGGKFNDLCAKQFEERKLDGFFDSSPTETTYQGLRKLKAAGVKTAISSNNFQHLVDCFLERHPLPIDLALGYQEGLSEKGRPHFERLCREFGITAEEIVFCGDSLADGERAQAFGVRFVGITGTFTKEQFRCRFNGVKTVDDILDFADYILDSDQ